MLIVGCGDIGCRVAQHYHQQGDIVQGIVRTDASVAHLAQVGILPLQFNLDQHDWPEIPEHNQLFYFAPPPASGINDQRVRHWIEMISNWKQPVRLVYLSTTGVYGDCQGAWIDEDWPTAPVADRAKRRLDAEQQLQNWSKHTGSDLIILRVAGIYGPGKLPLERLAQRQPMIPPEQAPYTNRIHSFDLVQVCIAAMERGQSGEIYNVSDGHPSTMTDYFTRVAAFAGLPPPPLIDLAQAKQQLSTGMLSYLRESRRLDNRKIREKLGIQLKYPTLDAGLPACWPDQ